MTDQTSPAPQPLWRRIVTSQQFLGLLTKLLTVSGVPLVAYLQRWFPDLTPTSLSGIVVEALVFLIGAGIGWYRDHPNNILARAAKVIEGSPAVSPTAMAKIDAALDVASDKKL